MGAMISFVETKLFTRLVQEYLSDDEYSELQQVAHRQPGSRRRYYRLGWCAQTTLGDPRAWKARRHPSHLFLRTQRGQIWMLTLYPKSVAESIPAHILKQIKDEIDG
jgi:hypothetical protein